jgi:magnesium transporter
MNITLPSNRAEPGYPLNVFGIAITLVCLVLTGYLSLVHHWWNSAKRRRIAMLH